MPNDSTLEWVGVPSLGVRVTPLDAQGVIAWLAARKGTHALLLHHNLHSAHVHLGDPHAQALYRRADAVVIDGYPVLLAASRARKRRLASRFRIGSTDWIAALPALDTPPWRLFVYGADATINARCVEVLRERLPTWEIGGLEGYGPPAIGSAAIAAFRPDLVLVGLGMPLQETFVAATTPEPPAIYATVGGAISYIAGVTTLAPRWLGGVGLEWAWRLLHSPRRLARRYLIEPVQFAGEAMRQRPLRHSLAGYDGTSPAQNTASADD